MAGSEPRPQTSRAAVCVYLLIPTKKVWVKLIYVVDYIVTFGTSVAVFQALADTLKTKIDRNQRNVPKIKISEVMHM